jgi:hypothetical protein
MTKIVKGS